MEDAVSLSLVGAWREMDANGWKGGIVLLWEMESLKCNLEGSKEAE